MCSPATQSTCASWQACAGDLSELEAVAATVSGKENVAGDAAVIQAKARELELLVPRIMARQAARTDTGLDPQSMLLAYLPAPSSGRQLAVNASFNPRVLFSRAIGDCP